MRRALISTFDKTGLLPLCELLIQSKVEIITTGNTARFLQANGIPVVDVATITGFPEILDGRVKTLHPRVFSGVLARRNVISHMKTLETHQIGTIDVVIVNLYPFEKVVSSLGATPSDCIENIDVGGPSLLRAAAKNFEDVVVLSDPSQYDDFISQFSSPQGVSLENRRLWAAAAFERTARYDHAISAWFSAKPLRYGENPHQKARVVVTQKGGIPLAGTVPLQGKELSYNNLLDSNAAILSLRCLMDNLTIETDQGCVIIKHGTPCGAALKTTLFEAVKNAFSSDPISAFGGIFALSAPVDKEIALFLKGHFLEVIIAPDFSMEALEVLGSKKDVRLLKLPTLMFGELEFESMRNILGGCLIQETDIKSEDLHQRETVSAKQPSAQECYDLEIAVRLATPCLSNAITIVKDGQLIGVGAGQTSRIDAVKLAIGKAREHGHLLEGSVLASDGFFPFADSLEVAKRAGITSVIQPGGSKKDNEVISKANDLGLAMIFTKVRHFRH